MNPLRCLPAVAILFAACAGDNHTTEQSRGQPSRFATSGEATSNASTRFAPNRVYRILRLETADAPRGEWRALGQSIRQNGSTIEFEELGSGKPISFTAPHQVTATGSRSDRATNQSNSESPGQTRSEIPAPTAR